MCTRIVRRLSIAVLLLSIGIVSGSIALAQSPSASPTATATGTPEATPTATPTPVPTAVFDGRPCEVGTLVNGFLLVQSPPPLDRRPTCVVEVTSSAPERLYRFQAVPEGLRLRGIERNPTAGGSATVVYESVLDAGVPAVTITLGRMFSEPDFVQLRDVSVAGAADYLPRPGLSIDTGVNELVAMWHEAAGRYTMVIDTGRTSLTLQEAAALLEPFTVPAAPDTGSGQREEPTAPRAPLAVVVGVALLGAAPVVWELRRRR
jgi:hypothetical protein